MKCKIKLIMIFLFITGTIIRGQNKHWTLPTPETDRHTSALIPYPEKIKTHVPFVFSSLDIDRKSLRLFEKHAWIKAELSDIRTYWGIPEKQKQAVCTIYFEKISPDKTTVDKEYYSLSIRKNKITITAQDFSGVFNALQTLRQLIKKENGRFTLPESRIEDKPAFSVRGIMLDVGRNYMSVPLIKDIVRKLSRYKINVLHLHLTDDPGWRLEIKKYPRLTDESVFWKTRQPGKYYTQMEITDLCNYCDSFNVRVIPEIDMPGHSAAFAKAIGSKMQSERGMSMLKEAIDEAVPLFKDSLFHIGSDEVHFEMKNFMSEMINYVRNKGKEVIVWYPGFVPDSSAILMCWGENEAGHSIDKSKPMRYIDSNGFYLDWMDSESGVQQVFFQQPCEVEKGNDKALGSIFCVWTDGALSSGERILEQYPFYPCALTFAERIWRGNREKRKDLMAKLPPKGSVEWKAFSEFENRLTTHRDNFFRNDPFAYVRQADICWKLIGPFDHKGINDTSFEPERIIKKEYTLNDSVLKWNDTTAYGGAIHIRHLYAMFNMHRGIYRTEHWPTVMSPAVGKGDGTCYALSYVKSPVEQEVYLMFGLNGMWGHTGGYRTSRAPEQGSWDFSGGDIWINDERIQPPLWPFESLPWTGWGQGRIETPLTEEGYFFRPPVKIKLKKGINKLLIRSVFGHWKGDDGERKWFFCCIPVHWDGKHYTEVKGLEFVDWIDPQ